MNGLALAYIGDAYYELSIRNYLLSKGLLQVDKLHKTAIKYTSGNSQALIINTLIDKCVLNDDEIDVFKKGRNSSGPGRKNIDAKNYHLSTGFEALIGYLYLNDIKRANEIIALSIKTINDEEN